MSSGAAITVTTDQLQALVESAVQRALLDREGFDDRNVAPPPSQRDRDAHENPDRSVPLGEGLGRTRCLPIIQFTVRDPLGPRRTHEVGDRGWGASTGTAATDADGQEEARQGDAPQG